MIVQTRCTIHTTVDAITEKKKTANPFERSKLLLRTNESRLRHDDSKNLRTRSSNEKYEGII